MIGLTVARKPGLAYSLRYIAEASPIGPATNIAMQEFSRANAVMLGGGYFNPLTGYMNKADALSVAKDMKTTSGLFWPTPVLNLVEDAHNIKAGDRIALKDPNVEGHPVLAVMDVEAVEEFTDDEMALITENVYRPNKD